MSSLKLEAGSLIPNISLKSLTGDNIVLGEIEGGSDWQMVVIYRGQHCPLCTNYLNQLKTMKQDFLDLGVEIVVASADTQDKTIAYAQEKLETPFRVGYDLSIEDMKALGLYISDPRSEKETDRPFAEPAIFVINSEKKIQILDISNAPFARPDLKVLHGGISFVRGNDYPIRGTHK